MDRARRFGLAARRWSRPASSRENAGSPRFRGMQGRRAVVFDLDGTIVDSRAAIITCLAVVFADLGLPADGLDAKRLIGPPLRSALPRLLSDLGLRVDADDVLRRFRVEYAANAANLTTVFDGITGVLGDLDKEFVLAIATSKPDRLTGPLLASLGLDAYFTVVSSPAMESNETKRETLARCVSTLADKRCPALAMIGDHHLDIDAARVGKLASIGVTWGMSSREEMQMAEPTVLVDEPAEILRAVRHLAMTSS